MNIFKLALANLKHKKLNALMVMILLSLSVAIFSLIGNSRKFIEEQFLGKLQNVDLVIGAKGSPIQLILSAVFHIDNPTGNIPLAEAQKIAKNPMVKKAIPLAYGDNYQGYRIVGTNHHYIENFKAKFENGAIWKAPLEVVLGSEVAKSNNLKIGDRIEGTHGLGEGGHLHNNEQYTVVGILESSHSVLDRLILTSIQSVWVLHKEKGHDLSEKHEENEKHHVHDENHGYEMHDGHNHEPEPHTSPEVVEQWDKIEDEEDITALLIKIRNPLGLMQLPRQINENTSMQAASPLYEMNRLKKLAGSGLRIIEFIALAIMIVAILSIFISLYNTLKDKKVELAYMRINGASRTQLVSLLLYESVILTISGYFIGLVLSKVVFLLLQINLGFTQGFTADILAFQSHEIWLLLISIAIGIIASIIPAIEAFYLNISKTLKQQ